MASISFPGVGFSLESLAQIGASTLRISFTDDPLQSSRTGIHDGLNPSNYSLMGPGANAVLTVSGVNGNNQALDLYLSQQLLPGTWTINVSNVQTISSVNLQSPTQISIDVSAISPPPPLGQGATSPSGYDLLRKFFNPALKGPNWTAYLNGLAAGDDIVKGIAVSAFDQLFRSTASSPYLDQLCADYGDIRPPSLGLSDDLYRRLSIVSSAYKTIGSTMEAVLEIFYGSSATRASIQSSQSAPWDLRDGDQLVVEIDREQLITITLSSKDFSQIGQASAVEMAMSITRGFRAFNSLAYALPVVDPVTNSNYVQIFSPTLGLKGYIAVKGGRIQNVLQFPILVATTQDIGTQWTIEKPTTINGLLPSTARLSWTGGTDPSLQLVQIDDYVNIFGMGFSTTNQGSYTVIAHGIDYVDINLPNAINEVVSQATSSDVLFFTPEEQTINKTKRPAYVATTDILDIVLPTTSEAIVRNAETAAYLHGNISIPILSGSRDSNGILTVNTDGSHGLNVGDWVNLQGLGVDDSTAPAPNWSSVPEFTPTRFSCSCKLQDGRVLVAGGVQLAGALTDAALFDPSDNTWMDVGPMNFARRSATATLLPNGKVLVVGGSVSSTVCELFDPETFTWTTTGSLNSIRVGQSSIYIPYSNSVLAVGGRADESVEFYDINSGSWTLVTSVVSVPRAFASLIANRDGIIFSVGGITSLGGIIVDPTDAIQQIDSYNPFNDVWTKDVATLILSRWQSSNVLVNTGTSGKIYIMGGLDSLGNPLDSVEIFDPATMTVSSGPTMPTAVYGANYDTLLNGTIIVDGGQNTGTGLDPTTSPLQISQIFNPIRNTWAYGAPSPTSPGHSQGTGTTLNDGRFLSTGPNTTPAEVYSPYLGVSASGGINGSFKVLSTPTSSSFTVQQINSETTLLPQGEVQSEEPLDNGISGPFIYDLKTGVAITGIMTTVATDIIGGQSHRSIVVTSTTGFPNSGYLCFDFGYSEQLTPVKYLEILSDTQILMDPTFLFPKTILSGTSVNFIQQNYPFEPSNPGQYGAFYLTTTAAGREAAQDKLKSLVAGGINYKITIEYPGDRGLGNEGYPDSGQPKLSDIVRVYGGDDLTSEVEALEE